MLKSYLAKISLKWLKSVIISLKFNSLAGLFNHPQMLGNKFICPRNISSVNFNSNPEAYSELPDLSYHKRNQCLRLLAKLSSIID